VKARSSVVQRRALRSRAWILARFWVFFLVAFVIAFAAMPSSMMGDALYTAILGLLLSAAPVVFVVVIGFRKPPLTDERRESIVATVRSVRAGSSWLHWAGSGIALGLYSLFFVSAQPEARSFTASLGLGFFTAAISPLIFPALMSPRSREISALTFLTRHPDDPVLREA
jgi:hypothetical protein